MPPVTPFFEVYMSSKTIKFSIPDYIYNHLREYLDSVGFESISVSDMYKMCATNRMINKGYLDEFGCPNPLVIPPKLDFSKITEKFNLDNSPFINASEFRSISSAKQ